MREPAEGLAEWVAAHDTAAGGTLAGAALLVRVASTFVLPLTTTLAGAMLAGEGETRRFVGLLIGLTAGLAASIPLGRLVGRLWPVPPAAASTRASCEESI